MSALLDIADLKINIPSDQGPLFPVRGVDLQVSKGETLAIVGESGCGKSLTALALMGLMPARATLAATRLDFQGTSLLGLGDAAWRKVRGSRIAMIFQDPMTSLDPCYTVGGQICEIMRTHLPISATEARSRALALFRRVGIPSAEARLSQYPHQLSGGLRQRVMIAMALSCEPDFIIADEPTTALDVTTQAQVLGLLMRLQAEAGIGIILITHDLGVVAGIAHRIAVMYAGQIVETGETAAVLERPSHPYTEGLLRAIPTPGATPRGAALGTIPGIVPAPRGEVTRCLFMARCPYARPQCGTEPVQLIAEADGHAARCIRLMAERAMEPGYDAMPEAVS
jgi:peptide/nickel transport system ATP-binding protein